MEPKLPLSVAIITKDEEDNISACLQSVSFADDVVVVDSGSTDKTVEIANRLGARVFVEEWKGDGPQKNSAVAKCRHEWILILDADERIPAETRDKVKAIINDPKSADAYSMPRKNFFHGKWIRHSDWWPDRIVRLARKSKGTSKSVTHSRWETTGTTASTDAPLEHYSFDSYSDMLKTLDSYSTTLAKELYAKGRRTNLFAPGLHATFMFVKIYFLKLGILDGFDGLVIAITKAGGAFFKYAKLKELQDRNEKNSKTR